jgi:hypothetical protein
MRGADGDVIYADGVPRMLVVGGRPVSQRVAVPEEKAPPANHEIYNLAASPGSLLSAEDHAGNRSTVAIPPVEEQLVLLAVGDHAGPAAGATVYKLPPHAGFRLAETIRGTPVTGESVRFEFQPREGGAWRVRRRSGWTGRRPGSRTWWSWVWP